MSLGKVEEPEGGGIKGGNTGIVWPCMKPQLKKEGFFARLWGKIKRFFGAIV